MSEQLAAVITDVEQALAATTAEIGPHDWNDKGWHERSRAAYRLLAKSIAEKHGAKIRDDGQGARVSILGVASTSTMGLSGAFPNWLAAARRKLEAT